MKTLPASLAAASIAFASSTVAASGHDGPSIERGRYLTLIGGCNDCHTPGFAPSDGKTPESQWLIGDGLGYRGPWGTTYPINVRHYFSLISEQQWLEVAHRMNSRPPMPSPAIRAMSDDDLRSLYRFVRSLGDSDHATPAYLPPGKPAAGPVVSFPSAP